MTQWQSTAGSATQTGYLSWNANGTLRQLQIIDTANSANSQTCTNIYDDLARLSSFDCGTSNWGQGFSYDAFGNITKSVLNQHTGVAFNPGYNSATNQVSGFGYDSMGDVIYDVSNGYSYDADGRPVGEGGKYVSYDAFGRAAEINNGGVYTDIVYDAQGRKFAYMNGQTLNQYRVPMVAGMAAVHVHGNPDTGYFQHADWLGSSRFSSTGAGAVVYDRAYAPFGEVYAELNGVATNRSFTGQTSDVIQGSPAYYDFMFRQQASSPGRWLVPDPAGVAAVDITNPQTWNRYAYVGNNPLSSIDPLGLDNDCGGPCTPQLFSYGNCYAAITYHSETAPWGGSYDVPDFSSFCNGSGSVRSPGPLWTVLDWDDVHGTGPKRNCNLTPLLCYKKPAAMPPQPNTTATISATTGYKEAHCHQVANAAFLTNIVPGGNLVAAALYKDSLTSSEILSLTQNELLEKGVEVAGASTGFKYFVRSVTGVPMSVTAKFAGWLGIGLTVKDAVQSVNKSIQAYQECMQ
jgi:RHS repeat-associated protein